MILVRNFISPRGGKLRGLFIFLALTPLFYSGSSFGAVTSAEREKQINRSGFPEGSMKKYIIPKPEDEKRLQKILTEARETIFMNPDEWIRSVLKPKSIDEDLRRAVFNAIESIDIWVCKEERCAPCSSESSGCATSRLAAGGVAVTALIHPCLVLDKKCAAEPRSLNTWAERVLGQTAYYKITGDRNSGAATRAAKAGGEVIKKTSLEVNSLLSKCPGPFSESSYRFLRQTEHLTNPVPAFQTCGLKAITALKQVPLSCKGLSKSEEWKKFYKEWFASPQEVEVERCDDTCGILLCQAKDQILYLSRFGDKKRLLIPGKACEGERLNRLGESMTYLLPEKLRAHPEFLDCIRKFDPGFEPK